MAAAYGLNALELPAEYQIMWLGTASLIESTISSLIAPLDEHPDDHLCISLDTEWNMSRREGVSIIQLAFHLEPNVIYIIPVSFHHVLINFYSQLLFRPINLGIIFPPLCFVFLSLIESSKLVVE